MMHLLRQPQWQEKFIFFRSFTLRATLLLFSRLTVVLTAFSLPLSTTLTNVLLPIAALFGLCSENLSSKARKIMANPVALSLMAFFSLYLIATMYTIAPTADIVHQLAKSSCLLIAALLIPTLTDHTWCRRAIHAFLLAMILTLLLSYIKYFFVPDLFHTRFNEASIFKDHIIQNFLMAFATFIFLYRWLHHYHYRWFYGLLVLAATYNVFFMSTGRSGYFIFAALLIYTLITHFKWKGLFIALLSIGLLFALAYMVSPAFKARMSSITTNLIQYHHGQHYSSVGIRIQSMQNALTLYKQHPIFGYGTGSFYSAYASLPAQSTQTTGIMKAAYNSYLNVAVQLGAVGLGWLLFMLWIQWRCSFQLPADLRYLIQILLIGMMLGCLANPWLSDTTELRFYALFVAVVFAALYDTSPHF